MRAITNAMLGISLLILIGSCATVETPQTPAVPITGTAMTLDDQFVRVAQLVPGFGGMFFDRDGTLNVYMADHAERVGAQASEARRARLEEALTMVFGTEFIRQGVSAGQQPQINILDGNYDVLRLVEWRKGLDRALTVPGVVFTDLDEGQNRLKIGVEAGAPRELVDAKVRQLGLPADVVVIEESPPIVPYALLVDRLRPVQGGVQIGDGGLIRGGCTLGFNALRGTTSGFVIASHCTLIQGDVGSPILQPLNSQFIDNRIGVEVTDPPYFTVGGCPPGRICRHSDSAFAAYDNASLSGRNTLVRPMGPNGSIAVDNTTPTFTVVGETDMPVLGTIVNKIGRSTGWTDGIVTGTCINVNLVGTNLTYLCQHKVTPTTSPGERRIGDCGDSGAPVFQVLTNGVSLHGILCCGAPGGTEFYFSSMGSIEAELGPLTTFDFPLSPSPEPPRCPDHPNWPPHMPCP
jgi:hypothetical protein